MSDNGSEQKKKTEEQEITEEAQAAEKIEAEVEAKEAAQADARSQAPSHTTQKKGLMERRKSFSQSSVPNAHRGYNPKTPVTMLRIILILFIASFILAALSR